MVLLEVSVLAGIAKWLAGSAAAGYGGYKAARFVSDTPEAVISAEEYAAASHMEGPRNCAAQDAWVAEEAGLPPGYVVEDTLAGEGEATAQLHRRGAAEGLRAAQVGVGTAFTRFWVDMLRVEFPLRADRPSDRAAMSKWLGARLREHGVRVSHIADMVPRCVALAINPSRAEVEAAQIADAAALRTWGGRLGHKMRRWLNRRAASAPIRN